MVKKLSDYQTNKAKALAIELAAIERHQRAYIMRTIVRMGSWAIGTPAVAWAFRNLLQLW